MSNEANLKTPNKSIALDLLDRCLESSDVHNAQIQKLDGLYIVEISRPTDDVAGDEQ